MRRGVSGAMMMAALLGDYRPRLVGRVARSKARRNERTKEKKLVGSSSRCLQADSDQNRHSTMRRG